MQPTITPRGVLLVGHGSRSRTGTAEFLAIAARIADLVRPLPCEVGFLELQEPSIAVAVGRLLARGVREWIAIPTLLFSAGHAQRDIPQAIADAITQHRSAQPAIEPAFECGWTMSEPLELHPRLLELSRARSQAALSAHGWQPADVDLVLIGRGGSDRSALARCREYAHQLADSLGVRSHTTGFVVTPEPMDRTQAVLREMAQRSAGRILVQPHLLFAGEVLDSITRDVQTLEAVAPLDHRFAQAGHLGADRRLARALLESPGQPFPLTLSTASV